MILKATIQQFSLVIERHVTILCPEAKLFIAVIRQAYTDILPPSSNANLRQVDREAVQFFFDGRMDLFTNHLGIDPEFVKEMLCRSAPGIEEFGKP